MAGSPATKTKIRPAEKTRAGSHATQPSAARAQTSRGDAIQLQSCLRQSNKRQCGRRFFQAGVSEPSAGKAPSDPEQNVSAYRVKEAGPALLAVAEAGRPQ